MLQMAALLIHDDDVPVAARIALASAHSGPAEARCENLVTAAQILHRDVGVDCADALELVGVDTHGCTAHLATR